MSITEEKINTIFRNREEFNEKSYIVREYYEKELLRAINRYKYVFVAGESGCGKTWLTTHIMKSVAGKYKFVNLSDVKMKGGFYQYFSALYSEVLVERIETKEAGINAGIAAGNLEASRTYEVSNDFFKLFLQDNKNQLVVLDNFETIINDEKMLEDLSCIITMADDPLMIKNNVRFLAIGATNSIMQYFEKMPNYQTIASRIQTISVRGFNDTECNSFVSKKFRECGFTVPMIDDLSNYVLKCTAGIPQSVNEMCYCLAISYYDNESDKILMNDEIFIKAQEGWVKTRLAAEYSVIRGLYNDNISESNGLNHVLYALCNYEKSDFSSSQVNAYIDGYLPKPIKGLNKTNIKKYLIKLSDDKNNRNLLVKKSEDLFEMKSFKTFACINLVISYEAGQVKLAEYF
ncbi:MAG: ATP-binding protein [Lachnospiraceae bacterium]|nr:ATP-binding protein [Lachnospiraceae bacterium]